MNFDLTFHCEYCDAELGTDFRDGCVYEDEFHGCVGERFGLVADVSGERILTNEKVYTRVERE